MMTLYERVASILGRVVAESDKTTLNEVLDLLQSLEDDESE